MQTYTVGEAAKAGGVTARAVRLYETRGLLPPAGRTSSGYRVLGEEHVEVLRFIRRGRGLGLSLEDIGEIMDVAADGKPCCERTLSMLDRRVQEIDAAIVDLRQLRAAIIDAQGVRPTQRRGSRCVVIESAAVD